MKVSLVKGKLVSYDGEKNEIWIIDWEEDEVVRLEIGPSAFPPSSMWNDYVCDEVEVIVKEGKAERIFLKEEEEMEMPQKGNGKESEDLINQPEFKKLMEDLAWHIGGTIDYYKAGVMDLFKNGIYFFWHSEVKEVHATDNALSPDFFRDLPEEEREQIKSFLEYCADAGAIFYWRDYKRFVWCVLDDELYRECCKKFGFRKNDSAWYSHAALCMDMIAN